MESFIKIKTDIVELQTKVWKSIERCSNLNLAYTDFQYFTLFKPPKRAESQAKRLPGTLNSLSQGIVLARGKGLAQLPEIALICIGIYYYY